MDRQTEEALCDIQAQLSAQRIALRALARTHPDPAGLLRALREALLEAETCSPVAPSYTRNSDYFHEQVRACAEDWTADLVDLAVPAPDGSLSRAPSRLSGSA